MIVNTITIVISLFIPSFFLRGVTRFRGKIRKKRKIFKGLMKEILGKGKILYMAQADELTSTISEMEEKDETIISAWIDFRREMRQVEEDGSLKVIATRDSSVFFNEERLLTDILDLRYWNIFPSLLLGMGVLGTFIGLAFAGVEASALMTDNNLDRNEVTKRIKPLLDGMGTAFISSIVGMLTSIIFNITEKKSIYHLGKLIQDLQKSLDKKFEPTNEQLLALKRQDELQAMKEQQEQTAEIFSAAFDKLGGAISEKLEPTLGSLNTAVEDFRKEKEESAREITDSITNGMEKFTTELKTLLGSWVGTANEVSSRLEIFPDQLGTVMSEMEKNVQSLNAEFARTTQAMGEASKSEFEVIDRKLAHRMEGVEAALEKTTEHLKNTISSVSTTFKEDVVAVSNSFEELLTKQGKALAGVLQEQTDQIKTVSGLTQEAGETLAGGTQQMQTAFNAATTEISEVSTQLKTDAETVSQSVKQLLGKQKEALARVLQEQTDQIKTVSGLTQEAGETLVGGTQQMQTAFNAATTEISEVSTQLKTDAETVSQSVKQLLGKQEEALNSLLNLQTAQVTEVTRLAENTRNALVGGIQQMQTTFNAATTEISEVSTQLKTDAETVSQSVKQLLGKQEEALADVLQEQTDQIEAVSGLTQKAGRALVDQTQQMQTTFNAATTGISEVFTQLKTDAETVSESVKQLLGEQEKQTAQVTEVTRLAENTRNALVGGIQQMQTTFNAATTEISDEISGVSTQLQAKAAAVSKSVEDLLIEQKTVLELLLESQTQQVEEVSDLSKNTGAALVGGIQQMQTTFNAATTGISEVSTQLKTDAETVSNSVKQLLEEQEKQTEAVRSLGTGLKTNLEGITELLVGNGISAAINSIDTSITDCSDQLEKAAKALAKVNTQLDATSEGRN